MDVQTSKSTIAYTYTNCRVCSDGIRAGILIHTQSFFCSLELLVGIDNDNINCRCLSIETLVY